MEQRSWDLRRRDTAARLLRATGGLSTTTLARVPRLAAMSLRGGMLALLMKMRQRGHSASDLDSIYRIVASLGQLKGVAMKMGQHLSYVDTTLTDEVCAAMAALQTHSQPMTWSQVTRIIRDELGSTASALLDAMEVHPFAVASIGQVHRARLPSGVRVAVKVQHDGIARAMKSDFGPASLALRIAAWLYPDVPIRVLADDAQVRVLDECDYRSEARMQGELARAFAGHPVLDVPAVHPGYSAGRVLTSDLVEGLHLDEYLAGGPSQADRDRFGQALFDFYVGSLVRSGVLNGDPHPGNYLFRTDGKLWMLDHGCTRRLRMQGDQLIEVARVFETTDRDSVVRVIEQFGGDALLLLRLRFGLASVLRKLGTRATWRDWVAKSGVVEAAAAVTRGSTAGGGASSSVPSSGAGPAARPGSARSAMMSGSITAPVVYSFDVVLVDPGLRTIEIVREVRDAIGIAISEAKQLVDASPRTIKHTADRSEADALKRRLEGSGAVVEIRMIPSNPVN